MATEESMATEDTQEFPPEGKAGKRKVDAQLEAIGFTAGPSAKRQH